MLKKELELCYRVAQETNAELKKKLESMTKSRNVYKRYWQAEEKKLGVNWEELQEARRRLVGYQESLDRVINKEYEQYKERVKANNLFVEARETIQHLKDGEKRLIRQQSEMNDAFLQDLHQKEEDMLQVLGTLQILIERQD